MAATETGRQTSPKDLGRYIGEAKPKRLDELPSFSHRRHCRDAGRDSFIGFPPGCLMLDCNWSKKDLAFVQHLPPPVGTYGPWSGGPRVVPEQWP
jgi:hypothetical protein